VQAVVYTAPLTIEVQDIPEPEAAPGEVIIDVRAVGICGSELEGFASQSPFRVPPLVMGHEFAGVRTDTGEHVAVNPLVACGRCDICGRGLSNVCRHRQIIGIQRPGGYAERVAVPAVNCHPAPASAPFTTLALAEPLANGVHALGLVQQHDPWPQRVGVIGGGAIGLGQALLARGRGIPEVELCDLSPDRLATARKAGITVREGELAGEYDVVFDTVGTAETRGASTRLVRPGGTAMWVGLHGPEADVDGLVMIRNEIRILTTFGYSQQEFRTAMNFGLTLQADWIGTAPMGQGADAFRALLSGPGAAAKMMLVR
jgi:threonine dehydrogenase-like Zn-dependent dehydrogenase